MQGGFQPSVPQTFNEYFRCYPITHLPGDHTTANYGGKIYLPQSALQKLTMMNVRYPMIFRITNDQQGKFSHSGVLEFTAEEGRCYLPQWMMTTLSLVAGSLVQIETTDLEQGSFVKLEPQSTDFLDISNPKVVLENCLRNFTTLTIGDVFELAYNDKIYQVKVLEVKPNSPALGICVIETDLVTDFAPPVGYVEPDYEALKQENDKKRREKALQAPSLKGQGTLATKINYQGLLSEPKGSVGFKLNGKKVKQEPAPAKQAIDLSGPAKPLELPDGQLFFGFPVVPYVDEVTKAERAQQQQDQQQRENAFGGSGQSLRATKKRKDKSKSHLPQKNFTRSPEAIVIDSD